MIQKEQLQTLSLFNFIKKELDYSVLSIGNKIFEELQTFAEACSFTHIKKPAKELFLCTVLLNVTLYFFILSLHYSSPVRPRYNTTAPHLPFPRDSAAIWRPNNQLSH